MCSCTVNRKLVDLLITTVQVLIVILATCWCDNRTVTMQLSGVRHTKFSYARVVPAHALKLN